MMVHHDRTSIRRSNESARTKAEAMSNLFSREFTNSRRWISSCAHSLKPENDNRSRLCYPHCCGNVHQLRTFAVPQRPYYWGCGSAGYSSRWEMNHYREALKKMGMDSPAGSPITKIEVDSGS